MRSEVRFERAAGNKLTGTLTSPNVSVPDQNGLPPAFSSSGSDLLLLALGSAFHLLPQRLDTLRQNIVERGSLAFRLNRLQSRCVSLGFLLNELHHTLTILVFVLLGVKLTFQHFNQLLRHRELFLCWRSARRLR